MATVTFKLRNTKTESSSIYVHLSISRAIRPIKPTGLFINPKEWKSINKVNYGFPKNINSPEIKNLKVDLKKLDSHLLIAVNDANSNGEYINSEWLEMQIDRCFNRSSEKENKTFSSQVQYIVDNAHLIKSSKGTLGISKSRIGQYKWLDKKINEFKSNIKIQDISEKKMNDFKKWLIETKKYSVGYAEKKLADVKTVWKTAKKNGVYTPFDISEYEVGNSKVYDDDMDVITLNEKEIKKIEETDLKREALINARKWLILACYTGQRGEALVTRIKEENFTTQKGNLIIKITQIKGNKPVIIPVLPKVKEIYKSGLPYSVSTQKLNEYFKKIGKIAELDNPIIGKIEETIKVQGKDVQRRIKKERPKWMYISTHIGRRSFATNHYGKIPTPLIMKITGHSTERMFLKYINQADDSHVEAFLEYYK